MTAFHCISLVLDLSLEDRSFVFESWYGQFAPVTFLSRSVALQVEDRNIQQKLRDGN